MKYRFKRSEYPVLRDRLFVKPLTSANISTPFGDESQLSMKLERKEDKQGDYNEPNFWQNNEALDSN